MSWTLDEHIKLYGKNFNDGLCKKIFELYKPKTVLEFGCGPGFYCKYLSMAPGVEVVHGIEPDEMDENCFSNSNCKQILFDITKEDDHPELLDKYDLVFTIEVAEHIDRTYHNKLFDFLCKKTDKFIVFSGARIGQPGHGHIACRDELDWRSEFTKREFTYNKKDTELLRNACNKKNVNHIKNVQAFLKN